MLLLTLTVHEQIWFFETEATQTEATLYDFRHRISALREIPRATCLRFSPCPASPWLMLFRKNLRIRTADVICIQRFHGYGLAFQ